MDSMSVRRIGVIGAGTMGNGIAQVFAQTGYSVRLVGTVETALLRAKANIEQSLAKFVQKGTLTPDDRDATLSRVVTDTNLESVADADYIVEAIAEDLDAKRILFSQLDAIVPSDVILSSN